MKTLITITLLLGSIVIARAQKAITINIEDLTKPTRLLPVSTYQSILENIILADKNLSRADLKAAQTEPAYNIVAKSNISQSMVAMSGHPVFEGMYLAYADHRPFTLSPDMMWLLICQGFGNHVNNNAEKLRHLFVNFNGKNTLVVQDNRIRLDDPNSPWPEVFPKFSDQIKKYTSTELTQNLTANFSTTTSVSRVASQITLMNAMKSYFNFMVIYISCGIPKVTLEGTPQDWEKLLAKTEALRKYQLDWWVDAMEPVLKELIRASKGTVNKVFWQSMFKYHSKEACGPPGIVDGWIVKFYPYNKDGKRNNLDSISLRGSLPDEMVKVNLDYRNGDGKGNFKKIPLELWAGFVGLSQDDKTFGLKPEIGWMIRKQDTIFNSALAAKLKKDADFNDNLSDGLVIRAEKVPSMLLSIDHIRALEIYFTDSVHIPQEMGNMKIDQFKIHGPISAAEERRAIKLLPQTNLIINGSKVN